MRLVTGWFGALWRRWWRAAERLRGHPQLGELAQSGDAARQEAGVDGPGDPWGGVDDGDDGRPVTSATSLALRLRPSSATRMIPSGRRALSRAAWPGQVAGPPEDHVVLAVLLDQPLAAAMVQPAVDDERLGPQDGRRRCEREMSGQLDAFASLDGWVTEHGGGSLLRRRGQDGVARLCGVQGEGGGHRRRPLAAPGAGDRNRPGVIRGLATGDHPGTGSNILRRRGAGRASPTRPVTPSGLRASDHRPAVAASSSA